MGEINRKEERRASHKNRNPGEKKRETKKQNIFHPYTPSLCVWCVGATNTCFLFLFFFLFWRRKTKQTKTKTKTKDLKIFSSSVFPPIFYFNYFILIYFLLFFICPPPPFFLFPVLCSLFFPLLN